jgi:hypothetical protein
MAGAAAVSNGLGFALGVAAQGAHKADALGSQAAQQQQVVSLRSKDSARMSLASKGRRGVVRADALPSSQEVAESVPGAAAVTLEEVATDSAKPNSASNGPGAN